MQNLTKQQQIIAKIVSVPGGDARDCGLKRLGRANGGTGRTYYEEAIYLEGLTAQQARGIAYGWDLATDADPYQLAMWNAANDFCGTPPTDWIQLGKDAARACGLAPDPEQDPTEPVDEPVPPVEDDHLARSRAVTRPIRKHAPVNRTHERFDVSDVVHQAWEAAFARAPGKVPA